MSDRLIIRLASQSQQPIFWLVFDDKQQQIIASGQLNNGDELAQLSEHAKRCVVDILVPGEDVSYFEAQLPKSNRRQAIKAIPYMLEEDLASPVETLHFSYGKISDDCQSVYICAQHKMEQWLALLSEAAIAPRRMMPDYLALPVPQSETINLIQLDRTIIMRQGVTQGQSFDMSWLPMMLTPYAERQDFTLCHFGVDADLLDQSYQWQEQEQIMVMQQLAKGSYQGGLNLLTERYAQNKNERSHWQTWRYAAGVAGLGLVVLFADMYFQTQQLQAQRTVLKQQSEAVYRMINPNVKRVRLIKRQMTSQLASLNGGQSNSEMLSMLAALNDAFAKVPELTPITIKFDDKRRELRLQADAKSYQQFDKFKQILATQYTVVTGAINNNGSKVNGSLTIRASS